MSVSAVKTPLSMAEQAGYMVRAWRDVLGAAPRPLVEMTLAHVALENDQGRAIWNNNPGNLTTNGANFYELTSLSVNEIGERISQDDPDRVVLHFWAFNTPDEGFKAYAEWLVDHPPMVQTAERGDSLGFAQAIKSTGYTPYINPAAVAKSLQAMRATIQSKGWLAQFSLEDPGVPLYPQGWRSWGPMVFGLGLVGAAMALDRAGRRQ